MAIHIRRREFIVTLGSAAAAWPLAAGAQQAGPPVVGFVNGGAADAAARYLAAFRKGLSETGFAEGRNVQVEYHWMEGRYDRIPMVIADLVRRQVAVIATPGSTEAALSAKTATSTIPIVFGSAIDPVELGLVASLARPGGNATGTNFFAFEVASKEFELLHELVPRATRIAVLVNPSTGTAIDITLRAVQEAARALGLEVTVLKANTPGEIDAAFEALLPAPMRSLSRLCGPSRENLAMHLLTTGIGTSQRMGQRPDMSEIWGQADCRLMPDRRE
jgi:putative ABC transport system substrate-binding protein